MRAPKAQKSCYPLRCISLKTFTKLLVSSVLIGYLLSRTDLSIVFKKIETIHWIPLLSVILIAHADRILMALKWRLLVQSSGLTITPTAAVINTYMGNFAGQFLPAGLGGDIVRIFMLRKLRMPTVEVTSSIAIERIFGLLALVVTAILSVFTGRLLRTHVPPRLEWTVLSIFLFVMLLILLSFMPWWKHIPKWALRFTERFSVLNKINRLVECYQKYSQRKNILTIFFFLSVVEVVVVTVIFYLGCKALYIDISLVQLLTFIPIVLIIQRIPISINGIGIQEGLLGYYLVLFGESLENAILLSIIFRLLEIITFAPGGLLIWIEKNREANIIHLTKKA